MVKILSFTQILMRASKKLILAVTLLVNTLLFGQNQSLRAYMDNKQFFAPGTGNYLEIYFQFVGSSVQYKGVDGGLQGEIAVSIQISKEQAIVAQDAYRLLSPVMKDSIVEDFYEVKRFALAPGNYTLTI